MEHTQAMSSQELQFKIAALEQENKALRLQLQKRTHEDFNYKKVFDNSAKGFLRGTIVFDAKGEPADFLVLDVNQVFADSFGLTVADIKGKSARDYFPDMDHFLVGNYADVALGGSPKRFVFFAKMLGRHYEVFTFRLDHGEFVSEFQDVTMRKRYEMQLKLSTQIWEHFSKSHDKHELVHGILDLVKSYIGVEAIGIRLQSGSWYPYYETMGFTSDFVNSENDLCSFDASSVKHSSDGFTNCICGEILNGINFKELEAFTEKGSFWTNDTTELMAAHATNPKMKTMRGRCGKEGYKSLAIIPLRSDGKTIGMLHFGDKRPGMFSPLIIDFYEGIAASTAIALKRIWAEEMVRRNEERTRSIFEKNSSVMLLIDPERLSIVDANDIALQFYGYPINEFLGMPLKQICDEPIEQLRKMAHKAKSKQENYFILSGLTSTGQRKGIEVYAVPANINNTQLLIATIHDITQRLETEQKLQESEERYRLLFRNMTNGFALLEGEGDTLAQRVSAKFKDVNPAFEVIARMSRKEIIGKSPRHVFPDLDYVLLEKSLEEQKNGEHVNFEFHLEESDRFLDVFLFSPKPGQYAVIVSDITERKNIELALKDSEERYRKLVNASPDAIVLTNIEGVITYVNSKAAELFCYDDETALLGRNFFDWIGKTENQRVSIGVRSVFEGAYNPANEHRLTRSDGTMFYGEVNAAVIFDQQYETPKGLITITRDVTERKQTEARILGTIIETEERERKRFAKDLHDDLGPLLSSIKIYLRLLSKTTSETKKATVIENLFEVINEAIASIKEISNNLSPHLLADFGLASAISSFCNKINNSQALSIDFDTNAQNQRFDNKVEVILYRISKELLNNTIKHANANEVAIVLMLQDDQLTFDYQDDGDGFEVEKQMRKQQGMGLSNVLSRVKSLNGKCKITSGRNKGFKVSINLNLCEININFMKK